MQEPFVLQGPCVIAFNGQYFYTQSDVTVALQRETWNPASSFGPSLGERMKSAVWKITFTPYGQWPGADNIAKYYPYSPADIGKSILGGAVDIYSLSQGKQWTYKRAGIDSMSALSLSPLKTLFGQMSLIAIGAAATASTDAAFMKTIATMALADTSYDPDNAFSDIYQAAWGSSPYDAMGAHDGFEIEQSMAVKNLNSADKGITDVILSDLGASVKFAPSNLTQAQVDTLLAFQGSGVFLPGQPFGSQDLVITGSRIIVTAKRVGPKDGGYKHQIGENEVQPVSFVNNMAYAAGVGAKLIQFSDVGSG